MCGQTESFWDYEIIKLWNARIRTVDQGQKLVYAAIPQAKQCSPMVD